MINRGFQAIETYQLLENGGLVHCYVCDAGNLTNSDFCCACKAPMGLGYRPDKKKPRPKLVAVLGAPASGKTVYLGLLTDVLSRQHGALQILARGAFSVSLQHQAMLALARHRFPPRTPAAGNWNWVHCEVSGLAKRQSVELVLPDFSGEAFLDEVEQTPEKSMIRSFLDRCSAAIILVDCEQLERGNQEPDILSMKMLAYLLELNDDPKNGWARRPLAFVFSKSDQSEACSRAPVEFASQYTPGLTRLCNDKLKRSQFFSTTAVGSCAQFKLRGEPVSVPLRIEPRGVVEPFVWLVDQLTSKRKRMPLVGL